MLSIIDTLILAQEGGLYVYNKNYKRIGERVLDKGNFELSDEDPITSISNLIVSEDKLNISITSLLKGTVELDPAKASSVGLPPTIESKKFRTQTIIKNGRINTETLTLLVSKDIGSVLVSYKVPLRVLNNNEAYKNRLYMRIEIDLTKMDVVSPESDIMATRDILDLVVRRDNLIMKNKVLKKLVDNIESQTPIEDRYMGGGYTVAQVEVLKENGIDAKGDYVGVDLEKIKDESNFYIAKNIEFTIKGQASLPSVNAVLQRIDKGQKLNSIQQYVSDLLEEFKDLDIHKLNDESDATKEELSAVKLKLSRERLYRIVNNMGEFDNVDLDKKGNMSYTNEEGTTLLIAVKNEKIYN